MPECDYCGESFADEDAYLEHLSATHEGELSRIDQRRVASTNESAGDTNLTRLAGIAFAVLIVAGLAVVGVTQLTGSDSDYSLTKDPSHPALDRVEQFESAGTDHVTGDVSYDRTPPLSGPHSPRAAQPGYYESAPQTERIVHSLEHGAVVIYYDPDAIDSTAEEFLRGLASRYQEAFASVIVAPHPAEDPESSFVLTAWRHRLTLDSFDRDAVMAFSSEFLGRGPERVVRPTPEDNARIVAPERPALAG